MADSAYKQKVDSSVNSGGQTQALSAGSDAASKDSQMTQGFDPAQGQVAALLTEGESAKKGNDPYGTFNYYKDGGGLGSSYFGLIDGKPIHQHSFDSLKKLSNSGSKLNISYTDGDKPRTLYGRLFALGRYQIIPDTREGCRVALGLKGSDLFSPQVQDMCYSKYLIVKKRPAVMAYLTGNGDIEKAARELAMEWASVGIAPGSKGAYKTGGSKGLTSYYEGDGVNSASISYERIKAALMADKAAIENGGIAEQTIGKEPVKEEEQKPSTGDTTKTPEMAPTSVNIDLNKAVARNKAYNYGRETWKEIQRGVGLTGNDVDGYVGKITTQAIANWQAANGFTGKDVDGICGPKTLAAIRAKSKGNPEPENDDSPAVKDENKPAPETPKDPEQPQKQEPVQNPGAPADVSYTGTDTVRKGASNKNAVKAVQTYLNHYGFNCGEVDGSFGFNTHVQTMRYQFTRGLSIDGVIGSGTWGAFRSNAAAVKAINATDAYDYTNGKCLGNIELKQFNGGGLLVPKGAEKFNEMKAAYNEEKTKYGASSSDQLTTCCSYRGMTDEGTQAVAGNDGTKGQIELRALYDFGRGNPADRPGWSKHQNGRAVDISNCTGPKYNWMVDNCGRFGFSGISSEAWHYNFFN